MTHSKVRAVASESDPPSRSRISVLVPLAVVALTGIILAWVAWPTLRPVRAVTVTQAIFDRSEASVRAVAETESSSPPRTNKAVQAAGWLEAEPFETPCTALADGVVERIDVLEGDRVTKGQVVARLVAEDSELRLALANAALDVATADQALAEAELRAAQEIWDEPVDRERAAAVGRAALAESEAELAQLPSLIDSARAILARLNDEYTRANDSLERGAATDYEVTVALQQVREQEANVASLEAREPALRARVERLRAEHRAAERHLELRIEERRDLDAAKANLERAKAAISRATAARDEAALELERMTIRAPIDGHVQRRLKGPGDKVIRMMDSPESAQLAILYDPSSLRVRVDVPLADASHVFVGQRCEVVVEILPDRVFEGVVLRTTHEADLQKNTLEIHVGVNDPSPLLRPEMLTRVKFLPDGEGLSQDGAAEQRSDRRVLAPENAIDTGAGSSRIWAVRDREGVRGVVRPVGVEIIERTDGWATLRGDVHAGELLVLSPQGLLDGERVRFTAAESGGAL